MKANSPQTSTSENTDEIYFTWYLDELIAHEFLKSYDREPETFSVLKEYSYLREKQFVSKPNELEEFNLLQGINYTYDYRLVWEEKALNIFTEIMYSYEKDAFFKFGKPAFISHEILIDGQTEIVSYVDVKPHTNAMRAGAKSSSYYTFPLIQKILLSNFGLYVNKIVPTNSGKYGKSTNLFATTFTPNRYMFTDGGKQFRKIPYRSNSITAYVNVKEEEINKIFDQDREKSMKEINKNSQQTLL